MAKSESFLDERREDLRAMNTPPVNGIDYVEVRPGPMIIEVNLVHRRPGRGVGVPSGSAAITQDMISITGGDRLRNIRVTNLQTGATTRQLLVTVEALGDFSIYTLAIDHPSFDRMLGEIRFSFRPNCDSDFDCKPMDGEEEAYFPPANVNYLAKDFESYRKVILDRMALNTPDWQDRQIPDLGITMVELLAHYADHMSYAQDVAGTEAYLSTARRRASVRRHAQLIGFDVHDGLSARAFVQVQMTGGGSFQRSDMMFLTALSGTSNPLLNQVDLGIDTLLDEGVRIFEPADLREPDPAFPGQDEWREKAIFLQQSANRLQLYDWNDDRAILPAGSTSAWIVAPGAPLNLQPGDFVLLELKRDPVTKRRADADPAMRQIVTLTHAPVAETDHLAPGGPVNLLQLRWGAGDALAFDLPIGRLTPAEITDGGAPFMAEAAGNIVLADHGVSLPDAEPLARPMSDDDPEEQGSITALSELDRPTRFAPRLRRRDISVAATWKLRAGETAASGLMGAESGMAVKSITLIDGTTGVPWQAITTLLYSQGTDRVFVPETESDGSTLLRFGLEDTGGATPNPTMDFSAYYRVGIGRSGNIGSDAIAHVALAGAAGPTAARNPLPGFGGRDAQSVEEIKLRALTQLDDNRRAVTRADYVRLASEMDSVSRAYLRTIGHGSWMTYVLAVDPQGGIEADDQFLSDVRDYLEPYRLMGQDLIVEAPKFAPIELALRLCVCRDHSQTEVRRAVTRALSAEQFADGTMGLFHPDLISFGDPVYVSRIIAAVKAVPGAADVVVDRFRRWRSNDTVSLENGVLKVGDGEIPILMNDPNYPERGVLTIRLWEAA